MNKPELKLIELFSGIGAQKRGIDMTGLFDCKVIATSDIDKYATLSYAAVHCGLTPDRLNKMDFPSTDEMVKVLSERNIGYDFKKKKPYDWEKVGRKKNKTELKKYYAATMMQNNLGDISRIQSLPESDMWTYSFPCQSISLSGLQEGIIKGETRSGLLYEVERLLEVAKENNTLPKFLLLENVKNLVGTKFINQFKDWCDRLDSLGFNTYWKVINGKNCGIPQNRERVFAISVRKDVDTGKYEFPKPFDNGMRLINVLENEVDEKYYLSGSVLKKLEIFDGSQGRNVKVCGTLNPDKTVQDRATILDISGISKTLRATDYKDPVKIMLTGDSSTNIVKQIGNIVDTGNWDNPQRGRIYSPTGLSPTINTKQGGGLEPKIFSDRRIRKLTETECWRLMGFVDEDINKAKAMGVSNSQLYKQAGNSIITNCIMLLMEHLYKAQYDDTYECYDETFLKLIGNVENEVERDESTSIIAALRGRYNEDGSTSQHLEIQESGMANTLTSVTKDNLVVEKTNKKRKVSNS